MNESLKKHKEELKGYQLAQEDKLKEQLESTKKVTTTVAKLALIGGASAYVGIKVVGFLGRKVVGKKKKNEPQIVYVQAPNSNNSSQADVSPKSFMKGMQASLLAALFPIVTSFAKKAGMKAVETYSEGIFEKYKYKLKDLLK
ncbi:hypothetical protein WAF17_11010 [Bernardetia sp. ABR2-2B]|uniref:hypothetical protein n=1 Tax=Bernardetia sp. ABR2-2B TaxID=3127472 RepID=UPI0030D11346